MFEPSPVLLAFLLFKRFAFMPLVASLSLVRALRARAPSRYMAITALVVAVIECILLLAPVAGLTGGHLAAMGQRFMNMGNGMLPLLVPSLFLAISAYIPGSRDRGIDFAHIALLWILVGLWVATLVV
ncbi:hypothetical protein GCM10011415_03250 [Salipiger pallidus]|uniref:Uncharacterized protein n=1 Tax=Salipiger pallidus TaxID=1775170 RepID=A0A8J2ZGB4_9RHOB|nr:hypothetical protein [Salipiger pallidus]GGG60641.1 hypothetical protein GCM10011415_03250 [Salipiger pallidus]